MVPLLWGQIDMNEKNYVVLSPQGRLDAAGARAFETEWKQQIASGHNQLLVDLSAIRHISSSGLRTLLAAARSAKKKGGSLKLCCLTPRVREIFEMAGFDRVFDILSTRDQADKSMSRDQ